ncbi:hypothetical protein EV644_12732 [Kribbella orskensis]|uniref:HNH endonuclease n=1 Tax=Kribbella orskensis TaxID=2512216 RepID=A0ABY2B9A4_9ACTN|nr:hypothetical protein EV642_12832 [Kribbella sp. VKM Ac-2500]TCO12141.1 hypothetical protein EV644_12732 [Kribbella orskensis]
MWGVAPGQLGVNVAKHERLQPGDLVLFARNRMFFAAGTVTHKFRNKAAAVDSWAHDEYGMTWELMFSLAEVRRIDWPVPAFAALVGYSPNFNVQNFSVLDADKSRAVEDALASPSPVSTPKQSGFAIAQRVLDGNLAREVQSAARVEQAYLRQLLLGGRVATLTQCHLCGRELPVSLLVAGHIKRRSECTDSEKRDVPNVAMLACRLGCDALFEYGYVTVNPAGKVEATTVGEAAALARHLNGLPCQTPHRAARTARATPAPTRSPPSPVNSTKFSPPHQDTATTLSTAPHSHSVSSPARTSWTRPPHATN